MVMDVILNMKLLNIEEIIAFFQLKGIVLLNVLIFQHVKITNKNIWISSEVKKDDQIL